MTGPGAAGDRRQGRNQTFNSAGNVVAAVSMGLIGYFLSNRGIFFFVVAFTIPTLWALARVKAKEIDYAAARGSNDGGQSTGSSSIAQLLKDRRLVIFLICAVLFHFANAAMLPLLGGRSSCCGHPCRKLVILRKTDDRCSFSANALEIIEWTPPTPPSSATYSVPPEAELPAS